MIFHRYHVPTIWLNNYSERDSRSRLSRKALGASLLAQWNAAVDVIQLSRCYCHTVAHLRKASTAKITLCYSTFIIFHTRFVTLNCRLLTLGYFRHFVFHINPFLKRLPYREIGSRSATRYRLPSSLLPLEST